MSGDEVADLIEQILHEQGRFYKTPEPEEVRAVENLVILARTVASNGERLYTFVDNHQNAPCIEILDAARYPNEAWYALQDADLGEGYTVQVTIMNRGPKRKEVNLAAWRDENYTPMIVAMPEIESEPKA